MKRFKRLLVSILVLLIPTATFAASNPYIPGPNNGPITVNNSSTIITPVPFPNRFSITFLNLSTTLTIYICQASQRNTLTLVTCSSANPDIVLSPGASFSSSPNGYVGQYTAITSSSTATLYINEN